MADRTTTHGLSEARRFPVRLPHWGWILATAFLLLAGGFGLRIGAHAYRVRVAKATIERVGGSFGMEQHGPAWLRKWLVDDEDDESPLDDIVTVDMSSEQVTTADLEILSSLSQITDLDLAGANINDSSLASLNALGKMTTLDLRDTGISEAGLVYLRGMRRLEQLDLPAFKLTEQGLKKLYGLPQLCRVTFHDGELTDPNLVKIAEGRWFVVHRNTDVNFQSYARETLQRRKIVTLVFCYASQELTLENESIDFDLAKYVAYQLSGEKIKVVDSDRVALWIERHPDGRKPTEVGAAFKVDYVIHIDLNDYSLFETESADHYRARADGIIHVIKMDEARKDGEIIFSHPIKSTFPIRGPIDSQGEGAMPHSEFRKKYLSFLSGEIGQLFYPVIRLELRRKPEAVEGTGVRQ